MPISPLLLDSLPIGSDFLNPIDFEPERLFLCPPLLIQSCHSLETMRITLGRFFWPSAPLLDSEQAHGGSQPHGVLCRCAALLH